MKNAEEQVAPRVELDDAMVCDYLQRNPNFFIRNALQVEQMQVPHPVRGTVSLVEWHMARQRHHIDQLENSMSYLYEQAQANEYLFNQLLQLQGQLTAAASLQDFLNRFQQWARGLGLAGANIRLFADRWRLGAPSEFTHLALSRTRFEPVRIQRMGQQQHYLGALNGTELLLLLPDARAVGSVAMSMMGESGELGLFIFSSRNKHHYHEGMGTLLLDELAIMLPALLERWIERI